MKMEYSCGAVVFELTGNEIRYVIVQGLGGGFSFPKGHMEKGESRKETALRELREEIGLNASFIPGFREEDEYPLMKKPGVCKQVTYFLCRLHGEVLTPQPSEISKILLLPLEEALLCFHLPGHRRVLQAADAFIRKNILQEQGD